MIKLNDIDIRSRLINFLEKYKPKKIIEELRVHNGNAIADVVTINKSLHCYEIKGDNDNINRVLKQAEFYNKTFSRVTLVTTEAHLNNALSKIPSFWGIIICRSTKKGLVFTYNRKAIYNPLLDKKLALLTLWKEELEHISTKILLKQINKNSSRELYASKISQVITRNEVSTYLCKSIENRK
ncbi:MAG: hypothetical protein COA66_09205 [Arcobacter sp.]|nr:MAG: hypothetical protein COA66_09205 [Arcobacter sp.]